MTYPDTTVQERERGRNTLIRKTTEADYKARGHTVDNLKRIRKDNYG
jgi:hypothetical protein